MTALSKYELEVLLEELENYKGRHTELISVYIPAGYDAVSVQKQIEAEKSTAKNIKSTSTRKNVVDALDKIVRYIKDLKRNPENGIAIFCGNVSKIEGQDDLQLWIIEPPTPLKSRLYRCDKEFVLDALKEILEISEIYALLVMDRKEAAIGMLEGKRIEILQKMTSGVPSKVRAGGQCLSPETIITEKEKGEIMLKNVNEGDYLLSLDFKYNKCIKKWSVEKKQVLKIKTYDNKEIISSKDHIFYYYKDKKEDGKIFDILAGDLKIGDWLVNEFGEGLEIVSIKEENGKFDMMDIEVENKMFVANKILVHNSSQRFHRITEGLTKEFYKRIADEMKNIFYENKKLKGILVGGPIPTKDEFLDGQYLPTILQNKVIGKIDIGGSDESGLKELVEKSQDILANQEIVYEKKLLEKFFETLGEKPELAAYKEEGVKKALEYGAVDTLLISKDYNKVSAKELKKIAEEMGSKIEMVSTETEEGKQFFNLSGIGALLRYKI